MGWVVHMIFVFTLNKHLNRQTGLKSIAIDGAQFGCGKKELGRQS